MNCRQHLSTGALGLLLAAIAASAARADFVSGHLYLSAYQFKDCQKPDQIWDFDPVSRQYSLFAEIPESCAYTNQLAFTPDGNLRAALRARSKLVEFSGDGSYQTLLGPEDGLVGVVGVAYDRFGSFYLSDLETGVVQYPFYGGPPQVWSEPVGNVAPGQFGFYGALPFLSRSVTYTPAPGVPSILTPIHNQCLVSPQPLMAACMSWPGIRFIRMSKTIQRRENW